MPSLGGSVTAVTRLPSLTVGTWVPLILRKVPPRETVWAVASALTSAMPRSKSRRQTSGTTSRTSMSSNQTVPGKRSN